MKLAPKNWREFQHYTNRMPPWIRLQRKLLDDKDFHRLPIASRALAPMLWLLASESVTGEFDAGVDELAFRLRSTEKEIEAGLKPLIEKGFFFVTQPDSTVLADGEQGAANSCPETEALQRQRQAAQHAAVKGFTPPDWVPLDAWKGYEEMRFRIKKPMTDRARKLVIKELEKLRDMGHDPAAVLDRSTVKGWTDVYPLKDGADSQPVQRFV